ncbi:MAG: TonB-dependent receptor [Rhodothermales bacterium]
MRLGRRLIFAGLMLGMGGMLGQARLLAQDLQFDLHGAEMSKALDLYAKETGVSVVYADRVVKGRRTTCVYSGVDYEAALGCLIGDRLRAAWLRKTQVVLSAKLLPPATVTVRGVVVDSDGENPLPGAHIMMPGINQGTVADQDGRFELKNIPPTDLRVSVSYLGYETKDVALKVDAEPQKVALSPLMIEGEAVVVEGIRSDESDNLGGGARSLNGWVQEYAGGLDQSDILQGVSTMAGVSRTGEISGGLVVRGGLPDQSVFLLDGAPVYQPWHSQGLFSILQPSVTRDVMLFSGPLPADQAGQLASVLDASLSAGSLDRIETTASISSSLGELSVKAPLAPGLTGMVAARRSHQGLSRTHAQSLPNSLPLKGGGFYDVTAKLGFQSSPSNLFSFTMYRGGDELTWATDPQSRAQDPRFGDWQNAVYVLQHRYVPNERVLVTNSIFSSTFDASSELSSEGLLGQTSADEYQQVRDTGLKINIDYFASRRHAVNLGVQVVQHHIEWSELPAPLADGPPVRSTFRDEVVDGAMYLQDTWNVTDRLTVRPGLRMSWFGNQVGQRFEPRFHSRYRLSENSYLRFAWSRQVQYLHQVHNIVNGGLGSTITKWIVSSGPTIAPSTGDQMVLGLTSRRNEYWTVSADLYWRQENNVFLPSEPLIPMAASQIAIFDAPPERFEDFIQGRSKSFGVELQAAYKRDWYRFWASYTGSRSLIHLPTDPANSDYRAGVYDTPHVVRASTALEFSNWEFTLTSEARTGYPTLAAVKGASATGSSRFPTYFRLDAALGYTLHGLGAEWDLQGRVYNLTDRENVVGYEYDDNILNLRRTSLLGVTRWPTFRLQVKF